MHYYNFETYWKEFLRFDDIVIKDADNEEKYRNIAKKAYQEGVRKSDLSIDNDKDIHWYGR